MKFDFALFEADKKCKVKKPTLERPTANADLEAGDQKEKLRKNKEKDGKKI